MASPVLLVAAAGGAYLLATKDDGAPAATSGGTSKVAPAVASGATRVKTGSFALKVSQGISRAAPAGVVKNPAVTSSASTYANALKSRALSVLGPGQPKELEDKLVAKAKSEYDKLSDDAKKAGCAKLKAQFPNNAAIQAINCDNPSSISFNAVLTATATAVATAYCGPACGALAAVVTAYIGPKLSEWAEDAWDEISSGVGDAASSVYDAVKFW